MSRCQIPTPIFCEKQESVSSKGELVNVKELNDPQYYASTSTQCNRTYSNYIW